jgi:hypothetical protein
MYYDSQSYQNIKLFSGLLRDTEKKWVIGGVNMVLLKRALLQRDKANMGA